MGKKKSQLSGFEAFEKFYAEQFGERWAALRASLLVPEKQILRHNQFAAPFNGSAFRLEKFSIWGWWQNLEKPLALSRDEEGLFQFYIMDPASLAPALALDVRGGDRVLDLCAAPGGKSLILAERLWAEGSLGGELVANDLSPDRRARLTKVFQQYLPREIRQERVFVKGQDGVQFGLRQPDSFDRILLDAPCSGERHLLENSEELSQWGPRRTEGLGARQYSLLCAAWLALAPGGRLVYSTCALSKVENDEVLRKFFKKKKEAVLVKAAEAVELPSELTERMEGTEFGAQFLPDRSGIGPIYFSVIEKAESD